MKKIRVGSIGFLLSLILLGGNAPVRADVMFEWSGSPIVGESSDFLPSGTAVFSISGNTLTLALTNTTGQQLLSIGEVLTGLTWSITDSSVALSPLQALIAPGSQLVGVGAIPATNLSSEWAYRGNISAGSSPSGPIGSFGVGSMGKINFGADSFGPNNRFDTTTNLFPPPSGSPNGIDAGIVGPNVNFGSDGFTTQGPVVQGINSTAGQIIFTFNISGGLGENEIANVQPLFGSDGAPLVPEPATLILLGSGLVGIGILGRKRLKRKD